MQRPCHKRSSSQTKKLELYLQGAVKKQKSSSFSRVEGIEAHGDRRRHSLFSLPLVICWLFKSWKKRGWRDSKRQTKAGRTVKKLSTGFSVTA